MSTTLAEPTTAARYDRCYYLGDYEDNGYHDSYFHVVYWDDRNGTVENKQYAATAWGGGWNFEADLKRDIPADVATRIKEHLHARALASLTAFEMARVMQPTPQQMPFGERVRITKDSRKGCKTPYKAGDVGEVSGHYWFGTFYSNGYNQKGRHNGRLGVRLNDGRTVFVAMTLVRLDCETEYGKRDAQGRSSKAIMPACMVDFGEP